MRSMHARRAVAPGLLAVGVLTAAVAGGQPDPARRAVTVQSMGVAENLYLVSGGGGHTAMLVTDDHGVVLVDTKNPGWGPAILDAVRAVTDEPVTTLVNTHAHGDHTGSNPHFADAVRIVAHENARAGMAASDVFAGDAARFLPNETYGDTLSLFEGRDRIDLYHAGPAHTDGDTIVVFPALATAHVGDLFPRKAAPFIDRRNGGSGVAYPDTLAAALARIPDVSRVIPGHAPPPSGSPIRGWTTWEDFREYAAFTRDLLAAARSAFEAGLSVDEAVAGLELQPRYPDYDLTGAERAVQAIYDELRQ